MAVAKPVSSSRNAFAIHQDKGTSGSQEKSRGVKNEQRYIQKQKWAQEEDDTEEDSEEEEEVDESVREDMRKLELTFNGISDRFRLINRIGEGTFSTVYKAEDLLYDLHRNDWNKDGEYDDIREDARRERRRLEDPDFRDDDTLVRRHPQYVAIKKIYVTSSPTRIQNELELLYDLRGCQFICPLITAFRHLDQVIAVLPYFHHEDFRLYYREMKIPQIRHYFRALFSGLQAVHDSNILHRDIKPTNFLYNPATRHGVLVDFGLAEREGTDCSPCHCRLSPVRHVSYLYSLANQKTSTGYPKNDPRPSRRANRAGTRGFRAPEVLLKCTSQTPKIDIWSAGVILLTLLAKRFPFFNSADDVDATIEMASVFGMKRMKQAAALHGLVWECNIATIGNNGYQFDKLIHWSCCRDKDESQPRGEPQAIRFMEKCLRVLPADRMSANQALQHEFLLNYDESDGDSEDEDPDPDPDPDEDQDQDQNQDENEHEDEDEDQDEEREREHWYEGAEDDEEREREDGGDEEAEDDGETEAMRAGTDEGEDSMEEDEDDEMDLL